MQTRPAPSSGSSQAHNPETGTAPAGGARVTARLYPSALPDGGWYVLTTDTAGGSTGYEPPPVHLLSILEELLTGDTDVTMSRRLSMSPRTFSRRVAELLEYLGVNTRFQAGMQVALHGWVPLSACAPMIGESARRNQSA